MAVTKIFDEHEVLEVASKCVSDPQLKRLYDFYITYHDDGVGRFMTSLNSALHVFSEHIDELSEKFGTLQHADIEKLLDIGVEGSKIAKSLKELRKKVTVARDTSTGEVDPEEPSEELDTQPMTDRWANQDSKTRLQDK